MFLEKTRMKVKIFDAHTHLQFAAFKKDYKEVIERALKNGIGVVNAGTNKKTSEDAVKIAHQFEKFPVFASVGLHPMHTYNSYHDESELEDGNLEVERELDISYYKKLAFDKKVVAIGECGLDYFRIKEKNDEENIKKIQRNVFSSHIELSKIVGKPLVIHCRDAFSDVIDVLKDNKKMLLDPAGITHFFSGNKEEAKELMDLGFYFTFGGVITFARNFDDVIKYIPLDRILVETDAPYVSPSAFRGKRNESSFVIEVVKKLSEIKNIEIERLMEVLLENTRAVFKLD